MPRTFLGGIAIAAGTGLAIGLSCAFGSRRARLRSRQSAGPEPLIERLNRIEARVARAERRQTPGQPGKLPTDIADVHASLARVDERLAEQAREIEVLRIRAAEDERLAEAENSLNERRFKEGAAALPGEIEAIVALRVEAMRENLRSEMKESFAKAIQNFEETFDDRVSSRINLIESRLMEHSASLAELSHRARQSNANLEKLVNAVERLCDQRASEPGPPAIPEPAPASEPTFFELPLDRLPKRALAESALVAVARSASVSETDTLGRPRVRLAHVMIAAAAAFIGTRFMR